MKCPSCGRIDRITILKQDIHNGIEYRQCVCRACGNEFTLTKTGFKIW